MSRAHTLAAMLLAWVAVFPAACKLPSDQSIAQPRSYILRGIHGDVQISVPAGVPVSVQNASGFDQNHHLEIHLTLNELPRFVSPGTARQIEELLRLRRQRLLQSAADHGIDPKPVLAGNQCDEPKLQINNSNAKSMAEVATNGLRHTPPYATLVPKPRYGLLAYIEPQFAGLARNHQRLLDHYRNASDSQITMTYYFAEKVGGDGRIFLRCGNEFSSGWGNCTVEHDLTDHVSLTYSQCLAMLPDWDLIRQTMRSIANDFIVSDENPAW